MCLNGKTKDIHKTFEVIPLLIKVEKAHIFDG